MLPYRSGSGVHRVPGRSGDDAAGAVLVGPVLRDAVHARRRQSVRHAGDRRHGSRRRVPGAAPRSTQGRRRRRRLPRSLPSRTAAVLAGQSSRLPVLYAWLRANRQTV